jgi:hypothetical protein
MSIFSIKYTRAREKASRKKKKTPQRSSRHGVWSLHCADYRLASIPFPVSSKMRFEVASKNAPAAASAA